MWIWNVKSGLTSDKQGSLASASSARTLPNHADQYILSLLCCGGLTSSSLARWRRHTPLLQPRSSRSSCRSVPWPWHHSGSHHVQGESGSVHQSLTLRPVEDGMGPDLFMLESQAYGVFHTMRDPFSAHHLDRIPITVLGAPLCRPQTKAYPPIEHTWVWVVLE